MDDTGDDRPRNQAPRTSAPPRLDPTGQDAPRREPIGCVLVIADRPSWIAEIVDYLRREGYDVVVDSSGASAFDQRAGAVDAAIVDLDLSARSGEEVCAAWRARTDAPVLAVAQGTEERTVLTAFRAGADDFAPIDVTPRQLLARLRSVLRRAPGRRGAAGAVSEGLSVTLDADQKVAIVLGTKVELTEQEHDLLALLLGRAGRVVPRRELAEAVRAGSGKAAEASLDGLVRRVREKLEAVDHERRITTVRGVGFRFALPVDGDPALPVSRPMPTA